MNHMRLKFTLPSLKGNEIIFDVRPRFKFDESGLQIFVNIEGEEGHLITFKPNVILEMAERLAANDKQVATPLMT